MTPREIIIEEISALKTEHADLCDSAAAWAKVHDSYMMVRVGILSECNEKAVKTLVRVLERIEKEVT